MRGSGSYCKASIAYQTVENEPRRRVWALHLVVGAAGSIAAWVIAGWRVGAGFAIGAAISAVNYRLLNRTVDLIGTGERPRKPSVALLALRYLILGASGYVIVTYLELNAPAVFIGLLVSVAAVILEILYELIYAGT